MKYYIIIFQRPNDVWLNQSARVCKLKKVSIILRDATLLKNVNFFDSEIIIIATVGKFHSILSSIN